MKIQEKIAHKDAYQVKLYKEGVFWIAYEQSAYAVFLSKKYKSNKKFVKIVGLEVVSLGFPHSALESVLTHFEVLSSGDTFVEAKSKQEIDLAAFSKWKEETEIRASAPAIRPMKLQIPQEELINNIREFSIYEKTPVDCLKFLYKLQEKIREMDACKHFPIQA